jgi:hypothetical protein
MLPAMFWFIWPSGFRGGDLKKIGQSETRIACGRPCLVMDHSKNSHLKIMSCSVRNIVTKKIVNCLIVFILQYSKKDIVS